MPTTRYTDPKIRIWRNTRIEGLPKKNLTTGNAQNVAGKTPTNSKWKKIDWKTSIRQIDKKWKHGTELRQNKWGKWAFEGLSRSLTCKEPLDTKLPLKHFEHLMGTWMTLST